MLGAGVNPGYLDDVEVVTSEDVHFYCCAKTELRRREGEKALKRPFPAKLSDKCRTNPILQSVEMLETQN
jgi:hypothetical protein